MKAADAMLPESTGSEMASSVSAVQQFSTLHAS
jgi:hypothetical protein